MVRVPRERGGRHRRHAERLVNWNQHRLPQDHALLSASKYHWLNYDDRAMVEAFRRVEAAARGTRLHVFAVQAIRLGIRLPKNGQTLNRYVNDAIGFRMTSKIGRASCRERV